MKKLSLLLCILLTLNLNAQNDLVVLKDKWLQYTDAANSLYHHLSGEAYVRLKQRADKIAGLQTLSDWQQRQEFIRKTLLEIVGPFPEKTPLNPVIIRKIDKGTYRVEHIIYESLPGFYVTSSLYIPAGLKKNKKAPAIIFCSGHSVEGYRSAVYQHVILNLVTKGFIVFAFDPAGQGERLEYYDKSTGKSAIGGPTNEHSYPGAQAFLTGSSQARYMIWDGIRAVDYLLTRKEIDPLRIGITGRSGGGTQSAYIAAFDDRIYTTAPENYLTNYTRLLQTIGPQDAEQNLFNIISRGLDHPDFLIVRAPKPAMMITTTGDMFSIKGTMETESEVARIYKAYGKEDNFSRIEDDAAHASTLKNREAMYAFFQKHLNNPGDPKDIEIKQLTKEEMQVTATGQVSTSPEGETVFSLNRKEAEKLEVQLNSARNNPLKFLPEVIRNAKKLSGYREPSEVDEPVVTGKVVREKYVIEKYFIKGEGEYVVPYLLFKPEHPGNKILIYIHPSGKSVEAAPGGEIEKFVNQGITVLAPDLVGIGEMGPGALRGDAYFKGVSHNLWYASMLIGRSITGVQTGDVVKLVQLIKKNNNQAEIIGFGKKEVCPVLLHAAAFTPDIKSLILVEPYSSFLSIVLNRFYDPLLVMSSVPGALEYYDLPDLASAIAPRKIIMAGVLDGNSSKADSLRIKNDLDVIKASYKRLNAGDSLKIVQEFNSF